MVFYQAYRNAISLRLIRFLSSLHPQSFRKLRIMLYVTLLWQNIHLAPHDKIVPWEGFLSCLRDQIRSRFGNCVHGCLQVSRD